jgi:hypothetical protein
VYSYTVSTYKYEETRTRGHSAKALWFFLHFLTARRSGAASFNK